MQTEGVLVIIAVWLSDTFNVDRSNKVRVTWDITQQYIHLYYPHNFICLTPICRLHYLLFTFMSLVFAHLIFCNICLH